MPLFSPVRNPASPLASIRGDHVGVRVPDLDTALAWYRDKLDFRLVGSTEASGLTWAFIAPPDNEDFMIELAAGPGAVDRLSSRELHDTLHLHGWHHVCLRVDSVDDILTELKRRDVEIVAGPMEVAEIHRRFAFFMDPWGNLFELTELLG